MKDINDMMEYEGDDKVKLVFSAPGIRDDMDEQVRILIGLNVDIIISMDNDVPIEEVRHICEKFYNIRNVYYTYDKWDLLGQKDSVADMPNKIFNFMMKYKIKYDAHEHQEYLKSLKK